jgi:hypothetical protein
MIPTRSVRVQPAAATPASSGLSPDAQAALMMINKEVNRDAEARGEMPPMPIPNQQ